MSAGLGLTLVSEERWTVPTDLPLHEPYRYAFGWRWAPGPIALCIGINPSFGTSANPDATMKTLRGLLGFNGFGEFMLGNPFARRSLEPKELLALPVLDAIGPSNDEHLASMVERADVIIACWGIPPADPDISKRVAVVMRDLERTGKPIKCFKRTKHGFPRHPLYLSHRTPLEDYRP